MPSLVFERYAKIRRLAEGGMGEVVLARQQGVAGFDRLVILKSLKEDLAVDAGFVEQFLDEARVAATLNHPNIVAIFEVGQWEGTYYIAMEYIDGDDLSRLWYAAAKRGVGLPFQVSVKIVHDCALALDHAHHARDVEGNALEIVHRDVSPQNIMVRTDGVTKLVDFGIAKATNRVSVTQTGTVKGKLQYMSPEQVRGEALDARSDQFSLGIVLWEMCTGKRLFKADSELATLNKILQHPIPAPSSVVPGFPPELEQVIRRMLDRDRERRFPRCSDVARELRGYIDRALQMGAELTVEGFVEDILGDEIASRRRDLTPEFTGQREASAAGVPSPADAAIGGVTEERPSLIQHRPDLMVRRQADGKLLRFQQDTEAGQWILDGQIVASDLVSSDGEDWHAAQDDARLARFFHVAGAAREVSGEGASVGLSVPRELTPLRGVQAPFTEEGPPTEITDEGVVSGAQTLSEELPEEESDASAPRATGGLPSGQRHSPDLTQPVPPPEDLQLPEGMPSPAAALASRTPSTGADAPHRDGPSWQLGSVPADAVPAAARASDPMGERTPATGGRAAASEDDGLADEPSEVSDPSLSDVSSPSDVSSSSRRSPPGVETGFFGRDEVAAEMHPQMPALPADDLSMSGIDVRGGGVRYLLLGIIAVLVIGAGVAYLKRDAIAALAGNGARTPEAGPVEPAVLLAALASPDAKVSEDLLATLEPQLAGLTGAARGRGLSAAALLHVELTRRAADRARLLALGGDKDGSKAVRAQAAERRVEAYKLASRARGAGALPDVSLAMASYQAERGALVEMEADLQAMTTALPAGEDAAAALWQAEAETQRALAFVVIVVEERPGADEARARAAVARAREQSPEDGRLAWAALSLDAHTVLTAGSPDPAAQAGLKIAVEAAKKQQPRAVLLEQALNKSLGAIAVAPPDGTPPQATPKPGPAPDAPGLTPAEAEKRAKRLLEAGRSWKAVSVLKAGMKQNKRRPGMWVLLGWAYLDVERTDASISAFKTATRLPKPPAEAHFGLAEALRFAGKVDQARASYERYLKLAPNGPDASVAKNALKALSPG